MEQGHMPEMDNEVAADRNTLIELGQGWDMDAIAACVVGGVSFTGGIGKISGVVAEEDGIVERSASNEVIIKPATGSVHRYKLSKFQRSNQGTSMNQKPIVRKGDEIKKGQVIADGPSTCGGEIALGKNPLIGFMTWEGYNYEDAVLLSERLVQDDYIFLSEGERRATMGFNILFDNDSVVGRVKD